MNFNGENAEVVIIGAGIAGLAAAHALKNHGVTFTLLEASHRIGGRAYSEKLSDDNWFDLGCSYLHNGSINPFVSIASDLSFPIDFRSGDLFDSKKTRYFLSGKKCDLGLPNPFEFAHNNLLEKINNLQRDMPLTNFMDTKDPYFPIVCHLSASLNAADPDVVSAEDYQASICDGPDYPIPKGFGNLVREWGKYISVSLNTKVKQINMEKPLVKIKTSKGTLYSKKVIITVSTGILSGRDIEFIPSLPKETQNAIDNLPMGTLNKIGISFKQRFFSQNEQGWYISWADHDKISEQEIGSFQVTTSGPQNVTLFAGGRFGKWLEERGPKVMYDYAVATLEGVFGTACSNKIQNSITTAWASEPLTRGAYSYSVPGQRSSRTKLRETINDQLYFAGEATETNHYGTAHGAYFSGIRSATSVLNDL